MKHRVLSHYEHKTRGPGHSTRGSNPDIPNAYRLFFQESMRSLGPTASMFPSSRYLANALTRPIDFRRARTVVELGPGTGAVKRNPEALTPRCETLRHRYQSDLYRSPKRHLPRSSPGSTPRKRNRPAFSPDATRCRARGCRSVLFRSNRHGTPIPHVHHAPDRSVPGLAWHHDAISIRWPLRDREAQAGRIQ